LRGRRADKGNADPGSLERVRIASQLRALADGVRPVVRSVRLRHEASGTV
jgi:hypothetical protein